MLVAGGLVEQDVDARLVRQLVELRLTRQRLERRPGQSASSCVQATALLQREQVSVAPRTVDINMTLPAPELRQTSCTSLMLTARLIDETD